MDEMIEQCTAMMRSMGGMMDGSMMRNMMGSGMMGGMLWPMVLGTLLLAVLIGLGVMLLIRTARRQPGEEHAAPLGILQERFARGEIDVEEY